jgi:hypothetical protein
MDEPYSQFVFHYYLEKAGNETVMQRGRLSGWVAMHSGALSKNVRY